MKLEIREITDRKAQLLIDDVHPYFVNALRRTLLCEVPKLAVDQVTFYDNTSALFDEVIAHRIGLVPLQTDPSTLNLKGRTNEDGSPEYLVRYTLTKEGPCTVYSGDLECDDKAYKAADDRIPIVQLLAGQRLILECMAILGDGTQHAKWQTCQAVGYKYYPTAHVDAKKYNKQDVAAAVAITPKGILADEGGKLVISDPENVNRADHAIGVLGDGFNVTYDDRKFLFRFETDGSLKAEDALMKSLELLKERFAAFGDALGQL